MNDIILIKAQIEDAESLTEIMKKTFDEEAKQWLGENSTVKDFNIQPPGYDSIATNAYMIEELTYFKILYKGQLVGGVILTLTGREYGRIDRIYVDPAFQGNGIGSKVMTLIEDTFSTITTWELETSPRQKGNLHFYEKMGYRRTFETEDEVCYLKKLTETNNPYDSCNLEGKIFYNANLSNTAFANSTLAGSQFNNVNLSKSTFQNINFSQSLIADLNLSGTRVKHVDMSGVSLQNCNLTGVEITDCNLTGLKIDGISVEELLKVYKNKG
ncbi:Secreted effector protein pipB2 [Bacillus sp. THAF10]|uniref:GNAT family N-acetyltransferase n=1 Tax=Bacillus sp. THAF10 TaxID=2587848 RepID=UPI0012678673|nr:GNAT family N-acetyltransferase [Bacillus sp. THAF10]QFT87885.1 Secreted effector protein pipB2 [Bacillus sp. THAF10]